MSEYHSCITIFKDEVSLIEALKEIGYNPQIHTEAVPLVGFRGDKRKQRANIIIPRQQISGASNDVGLMRMEDGSYKVYVSQYDESIAVSGRGFSLDKLKQVYAKNRLTKAIEKKTKYKLKSKKIDKDGRIRLRIRSR